MTALLIGVAAGLCGALGLGSGTVLMLLLMLQGVDRMTAAGLNLLFFPFTGGLALLLHHRRGLVDWKTALPFSLWSCLGAVAGGWLAGRLPSRLLTIIFGLLLAGLGLWELCSSFKKRPGLHNPGGGGAN